jgi:hypothetical protein
LQLASELVVASDEPQVYVQPKAVQDIRVRTERYGRLTALDRTQGGARHSRTLGDQCHREAAPQARQTDVLAKLLEEPPNGGMRRRRMPGHNDQYFGPRQSL